MKEENDSLSEEQSISKKGKIIRSMYVLFTSLGLFGTFTYNIKHGEVDKNVKIESNMDKERRSRFAKSLEAVTDNESIINRVIENRR